MSAHLKILLCLETSKQDQRKEVLLFVLRLWSCEHNAVASIRRRRSGRNSSADTGCGEQLQGLHESHHTEIGQGGISLSAIF
jgi:hypothetical protein